MRSDGAASQPAQVTGAVTVNANTVSNHAASVRRIAQL
jgi:hypothetical protein